MSQFPSFPRVLMPPLSSPIEIINRCANSSTPKLDDFSTKEVKGVGSAVRESDIQSPRVPTEFFVHCECALTLQMRQMTNRKLEIGVSEKSCWPCLQFLTHYSTKQSRIIVSGCHGKAYHSWLLPLDVSHPVSQKIEQVAKAKFDSWISSLNKKRISDSQAESSDPGSDDGYDHARRILAEVAHRTQI